MGRLDKDEQQLQESELSEKDLVNASDSYTDPDRVTDTHPIQISSNVRNSTLLGGDQDSSSIVPQLIPIDQSQKRLKQNPPSMQAANMQELVQNLQLRGQQAPLNEPPATLIDTTTSRKDNEVSTDAAARIKGED